MGTTLPPEIQVIDLPDGVRYRLPRRSSLLARGFGLALIGFGAGFCAFDLVCAARLHQFLLAAANAPRAAQVLLVVQDAVGVLTGLGVGGAGLFLLVGHSEVELRAGWLRAVERAGWLWWARRRRWDGVRQFRILTPAADGGPADQCLTLLLAAGSGTWTIWLAALYPRAWLRPLADDLTRRLHDFRSAASVAAPTPAVAVAEQVGQPAPDEFSDRPDPPVTSDVVLERNNDGLTLTIPPGELGLAGALLIHGSIEAFAFAAVVTVLAVQPVGQAPAWPVWLFLAVFWLPGLSMVLTFIRATWQRVTLTVTAEGLTLVDSSPIFCRRRQWARRRLETVRAQEERGQFALRIGTGLGQAFCLLHGRPREELEWMATVLRQALNVPAVRPVSGWAEIEHHETGVTLRIPPVGVRRVGGGTSAFAVVWTGLVLLFSTGCVCANAPGGVYLFLVPFWGVGVGLLLAAWHMGRRQAVLAVVGDTLMILQTGPLGSKRGEWSRARISHICAGPSGTRVNEQDVLELQIHLAWGDRFGLLAGRGDEELRGLAAALRQALGVPAGRTTGAPAEILTEQPADSAAVLERLPGGICLGLPPTGFRGLSAGLLVFGLVWTCFVLAFWVIAVLANAPWLVYLILAAFSGVGVAVLLVALDRARRRATLTVRGGVLAIVQAGPLATRRGQWPRERIARVEAAPSGEKIGNRDVFELQVYPHDGKKRGFLAGRSGSELSWVAGVLREALGDLAGSLPPEPDAAGGRGTTNR
jgi:hypothetical protein